MEYNYENIRLFLFETDAAFRVLLDSLLKNQGYRHITQADTLEKALLFLEKDLDFSACLIGIDIGSKGQSGLKLAALLREQSTTIPIIFLTNTYTEEVYNMCRPLLPSAFLNKELSSFKLQLALEQAFLHYANKENAVLEKAKQQQFLSQPLFFKTTECFISIPEAQILYFYSNLKITRARTTDQTFDMQIQLQTLEKALQENFARIHKSYLINLNYIETVHPHESSVVIAGETLPIGHAYRKAFFSRIMVLR